MSFLKENQGFTMIEIIVAVFLLCVGIFGVIAMFPLGIKVIRVSQSATIATQLAQEKIEDIISTGYDGVSTGTVSESPIASPFSAFRRDAKVAYVDPAAALVETETDTGTKKVEITVYWKALYGTTEKNIKLSTLISRQ